MSMLHSGVASFFSRPIREPASLDGLDCAFLGVPWDEGNGGRNGANYGPRALRDVSGWFGGYDIELGQDVWESLSAGDIGDVAVVPAGSEETMRKIAAAVGDVVAAGVLPMTIGGNHSITIGAAAGVAAQIDGPMGYLCIDAHLDTAHDWAGSVLSSGCPTHRACELPNVDPRNVHVLGVHGWLNPRDHVQLADELGIGWTSMADTRRLGLDACLDTAIAAVSDGTAGVYVSYDLDSTDPSHMPGTGTPEPGGFGIHDVLHIAGRLGRMRPVAFDVVELAPAYDLSGISSRLAAALVMSFLSGYVAADA